jgi:hypothetical protein
MKIQAHICTTLPRALKNNKLQLLTNSRADITSNMYTVLSKAVSHGSLHHCACCPSARLIHTNPHNPLTQLGLNQRIDICSLDKSIRDP